MTETPQPLPPHLQPQGPPPTVVGQVVLPQCQVALAEGDDGSRALALVAAGGQFSVIVPMTDHAIAELAKVLAAPRVQVASPADVAALARLGLGGRATQNGHG